MSEKVKNLLVRTLSGLVLGVVMLGAVIWSPWSYGALLLVLLVGGMLEFYTLAEKQGNAPQRVLGLVAGVVFFALNFALVSGKIQILGRSGDTLTYGLTFLMLLLFVMFICELFRKNTNPASAVGTTLMGLVYVALPVSLLCYFPFLDSGQWNPWVMVLYIFIIWANDVFAYLVGMSIGRHRLFERISPKKSWEGFFGGITGAVIVGIVGAYLLDTNLWIWCGLAVITAVFGVLGDLVESMLKRAADVKDSGKLIPGHGGVLDRFDAVLLSAPFVLVYMLLIE